MHSYIAIEGSDACGKTTQINLLKERFSDRCLFTGEPGSSHIHTCQSIRKTILDIKNTMSPKTEAMLYAADRHEHLLYVKEWLKEKPVIADRSVFSSLAYQPSHGTITLDEVYAINEDNIDFLVPNIVFYLEISPEERLERIKMRGEALDRLESNDDAFFEAIADNYKKAFTKMALTSNHAHEVFYINASLGVNEIHETIVRILNNRNVL